MQTELRVAANPQTKPVDLGCEYAENWQLSSTPTVAIVIITQPVADTHFTVPRRVEGWVDLSIMLIYWPVIICWDCGAARLRSFFSERYLFVSSTSKKYPLLPLTSYEPIFICCWLSTFLVSLKLRSNDNPHSVYFPFDVRIINLFYWLYVIARLIFVTSCTQSCCTVV